MTDENSSQSAVSVEQCDREAAADYIRHHDFPRSEDIRKGRCDNHAAVVAFARHRLSAAPPADGVLRRKALEEAAEVVAGVRSRCGVETLTDRARRQTLTIVEQAIRSLAPTPVADVVLRDAIEKVRDGYKSQMKFCDIEAHGYFRDFVRRIDEALSAASMGESK